MNPFLNPEFWLSLSFLLVLGLILFSPIQKKIKSFFDDYRQKIIDKIQEAKNIYIEAKRNYNKTLQDFHTFKTPSFSKEIQKMKEDFSEKEKILVESKKQDFQTRKNIILNQTKNHIRTHLLNETEKELLKISPHKKQMGQDLDHFLKKLHENKTSLEELL